MCIMYVRRTVVQCTYTHKLYTIRRKTIRLCEGYFCDASIFVIISMLKYLLGMRLRYYIIIFIYTRYLIYVFEIFDYMRV